MKLILFSDLHYAPKPPINNGSIIDRKLTQYALPLLEKLIENINDNVKPNCVINLGDLVEDFYNHDMDIVNITYICNILKRIKRPFYSLAGNHDLRSMKDRAEVEKIMGYNHSTFSINSNGYHLIFLGLDVNNEVSAEFGGILKTQFISFDDIEWLKQDLKNTDLPVLVFTHFGIAEDNMKGNWWFEKNPSHALLGNRNEIKDVFKQSKNILGVFSGHQHWTKKIRENGIDYYLVGSLTENINEDGIPDGIYFEIELNGNDIKVNELHLRL